MITHNGRLVKGWDWQKIIILQFPIALFITTWTLFGMYVYNTIHMKKHLPAFEESIDTWLEEAEITFSTANLDLSGSPYLPSRADVREIQKDVTHLILSLNALPTVNYNIKTAAADFHLRLSETVREIDRYDGTAETFTRIVHANDEAVAAGDAYNQEIQNWGYLALRQNAWIKQMRERVRNPDSADSDNF